MQHYQCVHFNNKVIFFRENKILQVAVPPMDRLLRQAGEAGAEVGLAIGLLLPNTSSIFPMLGSNETSIDSYER